MTFTFPSYILQDTDTNLHIEIKPRYLAPNKFKMSVLYILCKFKAYLLQMLISRLSRTKMKIFSFTTWNIFFIASLTKKSNVPKPNIRVHKNTYITTFSGMLKTSFQLIQKTKIRKKTSILTSERAAKSRSPALFISRKSMT